MVTGREADLSELDPPSHIGGFSDLTQSRTSGCTPCCDQGTGIPAASGQTSSGVVTVISEWDIDGGPAKANLVRVQPSLRERAKLNYGCDAGAKKHGISPENLQPTTDSSVSSSR